MPRPLRTASGAAVLALAASLLLPGSARAADDGSVARDLGRAYHATAKYRYEPNAAKDGFLPADDCKSDPVLGGMGYHYAKLAHLGSTDPDRPTALFYVTGEDGTRRLVGAEWIVPSTGQPAPRMFGRKFDGPFDIAGLGRVYDRHVWLYEKNPAGFFARFNPHLSCP
ncbi:hypothetical protein ABZ990_07815 [Streptomyces sp. NPDC046203]|uniref:hypothetical protein n=1 Tax=Streptomyces sp. NPDC046203 TaxID=3154602 RepID=UPI0033E45D87